MVAIFEEFRAESRSLISHCQGTGLTRGVGWAGAGAGMPRNEEIGVQLPLRDGGNIEIYLYTVLLYTVQYREQLSTDMIIIKVHHQRLVGWVSPF